MFMWQLSPRISQSHDLVVGRPNLRPVKAVHKVTFNQQTIGSVAMTHRSPIQADEKTCTVIIPGLQRAKHWHGITKDQCNNGLYFKSYVMEILTKSMELF